MLGREYARRVTGRDAPRIEPFGPTGDVVAHMLAHVPVPAAAPIVTRAGSLHDPRYVAWASVTLPLAATEPAANDGALLGELLARAPDGIAIQRLLVAFDDADALGRALRGPASELADVGLRERARASRLLWEIAWAAIGLAWPAYRDAWHEVVEPEVTAGVASLAEVLGRAAAAVPAVARERVRVSHPLGSRARCFETCIVVGAPGSWCSLDSPAIAARVVHEVVVRRASELVAARAPMLDANEHWAKTEGLALPAAARRLAGHALAAPYAAFVGSLDVKGLHEPEHGLIDAVCDALDG
jgi:hypothetical protein